MCGDGFLLILFVYGRTGPFSAFVEHFIFQTKILLPQNRPLRQSTSSSVILSPCSCDSIYDIPSTRTNRAPSFGYGGTDIGIRQDKSIPPIGTYELASEFKRDQTKGFSFGSGREVDVSRRRKWHLEDRSRTAKYWVSFLALGTMTPTNQC